VIPRAPRDTLRAPRLPSSSLLCLALAPRVPHSALVLSAFPLTVFAPPHAEIGSPLFEDPGYLAMITRALERPLSAPHVTTCPLADTERPPRVLARPLATILPFSTEP
jgi:hypothetical protein